MKVLIVIVSGLTAFAIGAGGSIVAVFVATKGSMPPTGAWWVVVGTGIIAAAKDTRSLLRLPPVGNSGNTQFISNPQQPKP